MAAFWRIGGYLAYTLLPYLGFWGALLVCAVPRSR